MAKPRISGGLPSYAFVLIDLVSFVLSVGPGAVAYAVTLFFLRHFWASHLFFLYALCAVVPLLLSFLVVLFCLRLFVPRLKRGVYPLGVNMGLFSWYCHLALSRSGEVCGLRPLLHSFYLTKFLYWRALGMRIPFGVNTSIGVSFVDLSMITIGRGCTISEGVHIACHTFVGDRLLIMPVEIGENVFVGMNCVIGPKTRLGDRAWIGMNNLISEGIAADFKLENFAWEHGNPANRAKG